MVTYRALVLAFLALGVAGCSCGIEAGKLDSIHCTTENDCLDGEVCVGGYCQFEGADGDADADGDGDADSDADGGARCPGTEVLCGGDCVDLSSSADHCGRCDRSCDGGETCNDGQCDGARCDQGLVYCEADRRCVDVSTDADNCGRCGNGCGDGATCEAGNCGGCQEGLEACPGAGCADLSTDRDHCGNCDTACRGGSTCEAGACTCRPGLTDECGGGCISLATDPAHCGSCDSPCGDFCQGGHCVSECPDGTRQCEGYCANTRTDPLNCGDCGNACADDRLCIDGDCRPFEVPLACAACPCDGCSGDFSLCCTYPGGAIPVCLEGDNCP